MIGLFALISLLFIPAAKSGAALAVCPVSAGVCFFPFNPLCIACVLANCIVGPVATACFSSDTTISKLENGKIKDVSVYELKENDLVLANNEHKFTKVFRNVKSEGIFDYIQIILESGKELTVTNEHGVIVLDDKSNKRVIKANNLKEGQILITLEGPEVIKSISNLRIKDKYILETLDGTVIANNIYVSTICDDVIDEKINADDLIQQWKNKHEKMYNLLIKN
jgi:intein/homing endonuclease